MPARNEHPAKAAPHPDQNFSMRAQDRCFKRYRLKSGIYLQPFNTDLNKDDLSLCSLVPGYLAVFSDLLHYENLETSLIRTFLETDVEVTGR